jgi:hypothetical protein
MTRPFKRTPLVDLLEAGLGDVLAARDFAETALAQVAPAVRRDARLLLTAACLYLQSCPWKAPTVDDLLELLVALSSGASSTEAFCRSPMQFVQFAGVELDALDPAMRLAALEASIRSVTRLASVIPRDAVKHQNTA